MLLSVAVVRVVIGLLGSCVLSPVVDRCVALPALTRKLREAFLEWQIEEFNINVVGHPHCGNPEEVAESKATEGID